MKSRITKLRATNLSKLFGAVRALTEVTLETKGGEVVAIMGPNGAGKSTLLSLISLLAKPTRGLVTFKTEPRELEGFELAARIGFLSHAPLVYPDLTCFDNLKLFARLYGVSEARQKIEDLVEELALNEFLRDRPCRVLSRGQLQRVSLARALIAEPDLLLLDEPAAGLDSVAVERIARLLDAHKEKHGFTILITHEPELAVRVSNRLVIMRRGSIVSDKATPNSATELRELYAKYAEELS